jgi:hypothetical protein
MAALRTDSPVHLDALGPRGPYRTLAPSPVTDVSGSEVARLSLVPPVYVTRTIATLRRAEPPVTDDLDAQLAAAGEAFASGTIGGLGVREYEHLVSRTAGTPRRRTRGPSCRCARWTGPARSVPI